MIIQNLTTKKTFVRFPVSKRHTLYRKPTYTNMKTLTKPKNFIIITGIVLSIPFAYAVNENISSREEATTSNISSQNFNNKEYLISDSKFIPIEKVRKGTVQSIDNENNSLVLQVDKKLLNVINTATTTFYFGNEEEAKLSDININTKIYVSGYIKSDESDMTAFKIIIANKSRLQRK